MRLSVLLRTRNSARELRRFEECVRRGFDVVLVDHDSADETREVLNGPDVTIVDWDRNGYSFGGAINLGVSYCRGEWVVVISPHARPIQTDFWIRLERDLEALPKEVDACQVMIVYPGPPPKRVEGLRFLDASSMSLLPQTLLSNTCCAYRKTALVKMPFCEELRAAEDIDWIYRALLGGGKIAINSGISVYYENRASLGRYWMKGRTDLPAMSAIFGVNCIPSRFSILWGIAKDMVRLSIGRIPFWWWERIFVKRLAELTLSRKRRA